MCPADTDPRAWEVWLTLQESLSEGDKLQRVLQASEFAIALQEAGVRAEFPDATEQEVRLRAARLRYGPDIVRNAFGYDPAE